MWHALKGYKTHLGTKFSLNASKIERVLKKKRFFYEKWHQYVVTPTGQTAYHKQLKIGKCSLNIETQTFCGLMEIKEIASYKVIVKVLLVAIPLVWSTYIGKKKA